LAFVQNVRYSIAFCFCCITGLLFGQQPLQSTHSPIEEKEIWFDQQIGIENSGVINGEEYQPLARSLSSHPFFLDIESTGSVEFKGQRYSNVQLLYDVVQQQVVLKYLDQTGVSRFVELEQSYIKTFRMSDNIFRNIEGKGYYQVLIDNSYISLFARRVKIRNLKNGLVQYDWLQSYFVILDGEWKALKSNRDAKKLFNEKTKQQAIAEFLRHEKIKVSRFRDDQLVKLILFCNAVRNNVQ
jgi:hypothetical protein